jgi:hypothetical protein
MGAADDALVAYELAARAPKRASGNFRWAILPDGRYLMGENPEGAVRPADVDDPFWYAGDWPVRAQLTEAQLAAVRAAVERAPFTSARVAEEAPAKDGYLARLTLRKSSGTVVYVVEDAATDVHERWIAELARIWLPAHK